MNREWLGFLLVALSGLCLGSTPSMARLAQEGGASTETVALVRCLAGAGLAWAVMVWLGRRLPRPDPGRWPLYGLVAVMLAAQSFVYPAAVMLIPVSVAVVTFFLFPAIVGVLGWLVLREPLTRVRVAGLVLGFLGVMLTVGAAPRGLDALGLGFAFTAAVVTAISIVYGARLMRAAGLLSFTVISQGLAALLVAAGTAIGGHLDLPVTGLGWFGLAASALVFALGILAFFGALSHVDAVRAATVANLEPVWAICLATLLFPVGIEGLQWLGAALVIGAALAGPLFDRARATDRPAHSADSDSR